MGYVIAVVIWLLLVVFIFFFIDGAGGANPSVFQEPEKIKTCDELGDELCFYCPLTDWGTQAVNTCAMTLCEGRKCSEAYECYLEENSKMKSQEINPIILAAIERRNILPDEMKLFFINETDYVAAFNEESAIQFYETEFDIVEKIDEIPKTEWGNMTITIIDDPDEGVNDEPLKTTFAEWMEQFSEMDLPLIVASNDY